MPLFWRQIAHEPLEGSLLRAQSQDDAKRRGQRSIEVAQKALRLARSRGWISGRPDPAAAHDQLPAAPSR